MARRRASDSSVSKIMTSSKDVVRPIREWTSADRAMPKSRSSDPGEPIVIVPRSTPTRFAGLEEIRRKLGVDR